MATIRPFAALRPPKQYAEQVSCLPYDVMNHAEACAMAAGNASSFLHICRADIDTSEAAIHDEITYQKSRENLENFIRKGFLVRENAPAYYIYRQMMWGRVQTGIVGCASVDEYLDGTIKKHELTRKEKELDRINHFDACSTQTEPVFLAYRKHEGIATAIREWIKFHKPEYDFTSDDGVTHLLWPVTDDEVIASIRKGFEEVPTLYIADGHHRTASSAAVSAKRRQQHPDYTGEEEYNYLMAVTFSDEDLFIMDYNRVVADLNGLTAEQFLQAIGEQFTVTPAKPGAPYAPKSKHEFGMYLNNTWYVITAKEGSFDANHPIDSLDCAILQSNLLAPILGINDPRTDNRIDFVGGIRGLEELERRTGEGVAFALYPVTMADLFHVADSGEIMPPKSTWFEPKLRSGLFAHEIEH
ncbi:MAG: DUF1015 domain-containing protein [Akkermansia sp.]|nr:DUF1015 domain-containing protein [Akkermansiaceae bacterium]MBQ3143002.1 DUF1015 domain-containing protein [Akkermansia sp.]